MLSPLQRENELPSAYAVAHAQSRFKKGVAGLRDKISTIERELLRKVVEDPRFQEGPGFVVEQLQKCVASVNSQGCGDSAGGLGGGTFLTNLGNGGSGQATPRSSARNGSNVCSDHGSALCGSAGAGPAVAQATAKGGVDVGILETVTAEAVLQNWSNEVARLCLEDWELEESVSKLVQSQSQIEKLDRDKIESHRVYLQELQSLRDRLTRLERRTPIEFTIPVGDLVFYEPTKYLEDDLRELVKEIVEYKVRQEIALNQGVQDITPELQAKIKLQEEVIAELREQLRELQDAEERSNERQKVTERPVRRPEPAKPAQVIQAVQGRGRGLAPSQPEVQREQSPERVPSVEKPTLCAKCGGSLIQEPEIQVVSKVGESKIVPAAVKTEKVVETVVEVKEAETGNDKDAQAKRLKLRKLMAQLAEQRRVARDASVDIKAVERGGPVAEKAAAARGKGSGKQELKALKQELQSEAKVATATVKDLERQIAELRHFNVDLADLWNCGVNTDPMETESVVHLPAPIVQQVMPTPVVSREEVPQKRKKQPEQEPVLKKPTQPEEKEDVKIPAPPPKKKQEPAPEEEVEEPSPPPVRQPPRAVYRPPVQQKPVEEKPEKEIHRLPEKRNSNPTQLPTRDTTDMSSRGTLKWSKNLIKTLCALHHEARDLQTDETLCDDMDGSLENLRSAIKELEEKLKSEDKSDEMLKLKEQIEQLKARCLQMEIIVEELQTKLKDLSKALNEAGLGDVVNKILKDVGLDGIVSAKVKAVCVFDRLYNDALRRLRKDASHGTGGTKAKAMLKTLKHIYRPGGQRPVNDFGDRSGDEEDYAITCPHCGKLVTDGDDGEDIFETPAMSMQRNDSFGYDASHQPELVRNSSSTLSNYAPTSLPLGVIGPLRGRGLSPTRTGEFSVSAGPSALTSLPSPAVLRSGDGVPPLGSPPALSLAGDSGGLAAIRGEALISRTASQPVSPGGRQSQPSGQGNRLTFHGASQTPALVNLGTGPINQDGAPNAYNSSSLGSAHLSLSGLRAGSPATGPPPSRLERERERERERNEREKSGANFGSRDTRAASAVLPNSLSRQMEAGRVRNANVAPGGGGAAVYVDFPRGGDAGRVPIAPFRGDNDVVLHTVDLNPLNVQLALASSGEASGVSPLRQARSVPSLSRQRLHADVAAAASASSPSGGDGAGGGVGRLEISGGGGVSRVELGAASVLPQIEAPGGVHAGQHDLRAADRKLLLAASSSPSLGHGTVSFNVAGTVPPATASTAAPSTSAGSLGQSSRHGSGGVGGGDVGNTASPPNLTDSIGSTTDHKMNVLNPVRVMQGSSNLHMKLERFAPDEFQRLQRRAGHLQARMLPAPKLVMRGKPCEPPSPR
eukprot:TRINITY_DN24047_c0_g1_i1.p1 TRINITY_DN24047_c0_g1~~TRINITY_DN24047_c0_g1_i1.p1  ORF type:complete len:1365 (+),score=277.35 TRINITY_DN24047_c0_g1_i1:150-4244(+)